MPGDLLDLILLVLVAAFAVSGYRQGFIIGVLSFTGFIIGAVVGTLFAPALARTLASEQSRQALIAVVVVFVAAMMKDVFDIGFPRQASVGALVYATALLMAIYGYAWIFAALTEAHTDAIRSRLSLVASALRYRANSMVHSPKSQGQPTPGLSC